MGLLGSTALIAASLAVSPAFAQTVVNPAGGGTITRTGGSAPTVNDQSAGGGGIQISNVSQATAVRVDGVTINNTNGAPTSDALRILGSTSGLNSTGVTLTGVNTLTAAVDGGAALYIQTNANMGASITSSGSTFTGSYGINLQALSGYISFDASNQSQSFVANGTHIAGFNAISNVNAQILLGSSTFTGFDTGINASNFYGSTIEMTGGSINALVTGIRTDATGGGSTISSQAAIVAPTGIHSTNTNGTTITTSGAGTINSTSAGVGTGILATSSGGSNAIAINVGAAIGNATQAGVGVSAAMTGTSTGAINITTTAAIAATSRGLEITGLSGVTTGTITIGADISAATAVYANIGSYNVTVASGVNINSTASNSAGLYLVNGAMTATNNGTISSTGVGGLSAGIRFSNPNGTLTNTATGSITGYYGAYLQNGSTTITNAGTITGTGGSGTAGIHLGGGGSVTNTNAISGYDGLVSTFGGALTNSGSISGVSHGVSITGGAVALTNTGTISTVGGTGGAGLSGVLINTAYTFGTGTITNSGTITGGGDATHGYGVEILDGLITLTNQSGGAITGGLGAILLSSNDLATLNLNVGSTVTGQVLSDDTGARTVTVAGLLDGAYDAASGTGVDTFTLASTGSITGAVTLGAGDDLFNWQGGTFASINANTGTNDAFNSALGVGVSGSLDLGLLSNFDTYNHQSGNLTLTGTRASGAGWTLLPGTSITLDGSLTATTGGSTGIQLNGNGAAGTVSILTGATLNAFTGVYYNTGSSHIFSNAGTVTATSTGVFSNGALTATNTGTITAGTGGAFSFGFALSNVTNSGTLTGGSDAATGFGVLAQYSGATVTNNAGTISGEAGGISSGSIQGATYGGLLTVTNAAGAEISGAVAITTGGSSRLTLNNTGRVLGGANGGVVANGSGSPVSITNNAGGQIVASGGYAIFSATAATINNAGLIGGGTVDGGGAYTASGNNNAIRLEAASTVINSGTITGGSGGGIRANAALNLTNTSSGIINGLGTGLGTSHGVSVVGAATILNAGSITGTQANAAGVYTNGASTVTNATGGFLGSTGGYGVYFNSGAGTFNNYGTVTGDLAGFAGVFGVGTLNLFAGSVTGAIETGGFDDTLAIYNGTGTLFAGLTDGGSGITLQTAGANAAATVGTVNLGGGTDTLQLRGAGDDSAANGVAGSLDLGGSTINTAEVLTKLDNGTWTLTGAAAVPGMTINAGAGGSAGLLIFSGTGLTGDINVNGATVRATTTTAFGTGTLHMIDPTIQFAATGTYANDISLEVADGLQALDPTWLRNISGGTITLSGRIYETNGVGGANQYVTFDGGTTILSNTTNTWGGVTTINSGATLSGAFNTISGGSITNNGQLIYTGGAGTVAQNITGTGSFTRNGTGALLLNGANNWTGTTTITAGELRGTTGSISGASILNNGTLTYQNTSAGTASQAISGSGAININGTGVTLAGAITTTGQLTISGPGSSLILGGSRSGASNTGVVLSATGGSLTVADGASLQGGQYNGVRVTGANASVTNLGLIQNAGTGGDGAVGAGVYVQNAGAGGTTTINNGSLTDTGAGSTIQGRNAGVRHESGSTDLLVVNNYGLIAGDIWNGVENTAGGLTVNNFAGGYITTTAGNGVSSNSGSAVSVTNAGTIGRNIAGTTTVGGYGVVTNGALTLVNQSGGLITGTLGGVQSNGAGSSITNQAGGTILGNYGVVNAGGTINNSGLIRGFNDAIILGGATALTNNAGGLIVGAGNEGVFVSANGSTISNAGLIVNSLSGIGANFSVAITNSGVIASGAAPDAATTSAHISRNTGTAIALGAGGSVTNLAGGEILGGVGVSFNNGASGTLANAGLIDGSTTYGVQMSGAGTITNQSGGTITGATGSIQLTGAGAKIVDLLVGSTANGQIVSTATGTQTVNIAGTLNGAYNAAVGAGVDNLTLASTGSMTSADLGAGADSFTYQGGGFSGLIDAGADTDSFISALGASSASVDLNNLANFETFAHQSGTLTLTGTGTFSGGASIQGGSLVVDGTVQSAVNVALGGTLSGGGTITGGVTIANGASLTGAQGSTLTMGFLGLSSGSTINATFSGAAGPALFAVTGNLILDGTVNVASTGAYGFGVYGLMTYGGVLTDNGLVIGTTPGGVQRVEVQTSVAGQINIVHAPTELLFWDGGNAGQHDDGAISGGAGTWTAAGSEWTDAGGVFNGAMEPQPGFAIFQGVGGVVTVDDGAGAVAVTGMQFAADGYSVVGDSITLANASTTIRVGDGTAPSAAWTTTIASALTGVGGLIKTDFGTLILAGDSDYTGGTTIDAGTLQIGDGATAGSIVGAVVNNAALIFARSDNHDFANDVSGSGLVNVNGVVTLSGAITAASGVTILNGSSLTSTGVITALNAVTFADGGAFTNAGIVNGDVAANGAAAATVTNAGAINGVVYNIGSGLLTIDNQAGGSITGAGSTALLSTASGAISLNNAGDISAPSYAFLSSNALDSVTNSGRMVAGSITGGVVTAGGFDAIRLNAGGSVVNQSGGLITGTQGVASYAGTLTLDNQLGATITGEEYGVHSYAAANIVNAGTIGATQYAGIALSAGGTITNSGVIGGGNQAGANQGISVEGPTVIVNLAGGVINNGILNLGSGLLDLDIQAGSTVSGSVINGSTGGGVLRLAGELNGSYAGSTGDDAVTLISGATVSGVLQGNGGVDSFELAGAGAGSLDISQVLGFESRDMNGAGVWTLTGLDSSTTGWSINSGTLAVSGGQAINDAVAVMIAGPGALQLNNSEQIGSLNGAGAVALGGNTLIVGGGGASTYAGVIGGTGNLQIAGGSNLTLSGSNTYSGTTYVTGGTLRLGASDVLSDVSLLNLASGGVMDLQGFSDTVASALLSGVLNGTGTLTAADYALNGATVNANLGTGALFNASGISTLNGVSAADLVAVLGGTLTLGASDRIIDTTELQVMSGATFDLGAFDETVNVTAINGTLAGTGTLTAIQHQLDGATVNANLAGGSVYVIVGASTLNGLSNADLLSVLGGSLTLGASDRIADTATLGVSSGAVLNIGAFNESVAIAALSGTVNGTGTLTAGEYSLSGATVNANLGAGDLYNTGGVSTLNGTSGADLVSVLDGTLALGASDRLADAATVSVASGATLNLNAFNDTIDLALLSGTLAGTGTLTAADYLLNGATVNANLGAGALYSLGASILNGLSGAGLVSVQDGTLTLGASDRLSDTANLVVASDGILNLGAFNETVATAVLNGALNGTGTLTAADYLLNDATVNANLGAGVLYSVGASTLNGTAAAEEVLVDGGVLTLGAANRLADNAVVTVSSGVALNLGAFDETIGLLTLNGALNGTGTLSAAQYQLNAATVNANLGDGLLIQQSGVSTLNGTSGATQVALLGGTLTLGASDRLADNATVAVSSGSTLDLGAFNDTVGLVGLNGTLAGTGTLTAAQYQLNAATVDANLGVGTLFNLGGVSTLNGTAGASQVSINAGTLRLGASERLSDAATVSVASGATFEVNGFDERIGALFGTGDVNVGAGRLSFGGVESGFGGRLSGAGLLVHTGGLFTLMGDHTIASISNTGGELRFLGTTTGSLSASGGSVTGAGTIGGALRASNGAILSPGLAGVQDGIGGFVAGGLMLNGGTLAIDVLGRSGGNLIDQLRINGTATLTGGLLSPTFQGSAATDFDFSTRYLFLQANNLVGTFANGGTFTAAAQEGLFWRIRYDLSPNAAVLELRELTNFDPGATGTGNQRSVGQALSGGQLAASDDWAAILSLIAGLSDAERAAAFDSVSGEPLADVTSTLFSANDSFLTAVRDGGLNGRDDGGEALNFVDRLSFAGGRENSADRLGDVLGAFDPSASTERGAGGWVSAYAGDQTLDGKPGQATVESTLNGFAGGYGVRNGSMSVGAAGGITRLEGDVVARDGHYESDLSHAAGYAAFDDGVWAADLTATFYGGDLDTRRGITVGAFSGHAIGNTHVEGQALSASVARRFQVSDNTMIALGVIGTASNASVDGYTETGAGGLSLQASGMERDWQSLQLSTRGTQDYRVNGQGYRIYAGAGVMATAGDRQATGDMRFTGAATGFGTFTVEGAETPPLAGLVDFGLEVGAGEGVTVSAGYRGLFSERLQDNQVGVKLKVSW